MEKVIKLTVEGFEYHLHLQPSEYKLIRQSQFMSKKGNVLFSSELEVVTTGSRIRVLGLQELTGKETLNLTLSSVQSFQGMYSLSFFNPKQ